MSTIRSKDRVSLCSFMFVDGRRCRIPRRTDHPYLCAFHARKEAQTLAGQHAGKDIAYHLSGSYVTACDLNSALGRLFSAVAQGQIKPKTAATLAYLGQTMVQALHFAETEYIKAFGPNYWRETVRISHQQSADHFAGDTDSAPEQDPESESEPDPDSDPDSPESLDSAAEPNAQSPQAEPASVTESADKAASDTPPDPAS
jgi:hypothetical protein